MESRSLTAERLVEYYLGRIEKFDDGPGGLRSVLSINPEAVATAKMLDRERAGGRIRGVLHGIPVLLKDNIDSAGGLPTTAGSMLLLDHYPADDAEVVRRLRAAGAIILGKANLSEWANFRSSQASSGWSAVGGQTRNPYDRSRSPCGSSAGSAVAVAADLALLAVGTETNGSIVCPAAVNGVVGIKPTLGRVSQDGIVPIARSQDSAGPLARTVNDAALLLEVMGDYAPRSLRAVTAGQSFAGRAIGIASNYLGYHAATDRHFASQVVLLAEAGAEIRDCPLPNAGSWSAPSFETMLHEFRTGIEGYLAGTAVPYRTLADLVAGNRRLAGIELLLFGQDIFLQALDREALRSDGYPAARERARRLAGAEGIDAALRACAVGALIAPTTSPAWKIDQLLGDHYIGGASGAAAAAGYPHLTVPMGLVSGLPVGMSWFAGAGSESELVSFAALFEQLRGGRVAPEL